MDSTINYYNKNVDRFAFVKELPQLRVEETWVTGDVRPGRGEEKWLNLLLRKTQ